MDPGVLLRQSALAACEHVLQQVEAISQKAAPPTPAASAHTPAHTRTHSKSHTDAGIDEDKLDENRQNSSGAPCTADAEPDVRKALREHSQRELEEGAEVCVCVLECMHTQILVCDPFDHTHMDLLREIVRCLNVLSAILDWCIVRQHWCEWLQGPDCPEIPTELLLRWLPHTPVSSMVRRFRPGRELVRSVQKAVKENPLTTAIWAAVAVAAVGTACVAWVHSARRTELSTQADAAKRAGDSLRSQLKEHMPRLLKAHPGWGPHDLRDVAIPVDPETNPLGTGIRTVGSIAQDFIVERRRERRLRSELRDVLAAALKVGAMATTVTGATAASAASVVSKLSVDVDADHMRSRFRVEMERLQAVLRWREKTAGRASAMSWDVDEVTLFLRAVRTQLLCAYRGAAEYGGFIRHITNAAMDDDPCDIVSCIDAVMAAHGLAGNEEWSTAVPKAKPALRGPFSWEMPSAAPHSIEGLEPEYPPAPGMIAQPVRAVSASSGLAPAPPAPPIAMYALMPMAVLREMGMHPSAELLRGLRRQAMPSWMLLETHCTICRAPLTAADKMVAMRQLDQDGLAVGVGGAQMCARQHIMCEECLQSFRRTPYSRCDVSARVREGALVAANRAAMARDGGASLPGLSFAARQLLHALALDSEDAALVRCPCCRSPAHPTSCAVGSPFASIGM